MPNYIYTGRLYSSRYHLKRKGREVLGRSMYFNVLLTAMFAIYLFSFSKHFQQYMQLCIALAVLLAGLAIIAMILIAPAPGNYSYYAGLILVFIFGYTFFKLQVLWATIVGWMIVIFYEIAAIGLINTPVPILISNNFFFLTGNLFGMFALGLP